MSDELMNLILGATAHMSPADVCDRITETEKGGYVLVSTYTATGFTDGENGVVEPVEVVCGIFRKNATWGAGPTPNPFNPEVKALA